MTRWTRLHALTAAAPALLLASMFLARAEGPAKTTEAAPAQRPVLNPPPAPSKEPMSDEAAGKGADLTKIGHSPKDGSPYLGAEDALVVVNLFTDFQCPVCRRAADPVKQLALDFPGQVKVVFRNNALPSHARAKAGAVAALAAAKQGKFWQYHDQLFASPAALNEASLPQIAADLGLDVDQWRKDVDDPKTIEKVRQESEAAIRLGVPGTPGIFVNGIRQMGWGSYRDLYGMVQREIAAGQALAASGTPRGQIPRERIREMAAKNPKGAGEGEVDADGWVKTLLAR